jgi:hypothetical protein
MPVYKYRCSCGLEFEDIKGVNDPNPPCPRLEDETLWGSVSHAEVVRIPSIPGPPKGGSTPKFYR